MKYKYLGFLFISLFFCLPTYGAVTGNAKIQQLGDSRYLINWNYDWVGTSSANRPPKFCTKGCILTLYLKPASHAMPYEYIELTDTRTVLSGVPDGDSYAEIMEAWRKSNPKKSGSLIVNRPNAGFSSNSILSINIRELDSAPLNGLWPDDTASFQNGLKDITCYFGGSNLLIYNLRGSSGDGTITQDKYLSIDCTSPTKYRVNVVNNKINIRGGVVVRLVDENDIDFGPVGEWLNINGEKQLRIRAVVTIPPGVQEGLYSGSTVLTIEIW
ncbi:TPA: hypothetical protein N5K73_002569 [Enterobacter kobei]|uniref:hypothetical protein n=1 Tax=Enterobacter kobei TaxID=208224 RepID=UPI003CE9845F|nr:hypothetical protein [Enterobacter kobei]HCM9166466.1 hypothetical protein [Enterobacter kobei]